MVELPLTEVVDFLDSSTRNTWVRVGPFSMYIRKGIHCLQGQPAHTFDLANISNLDEENRGRGYFQILIKKLEDLFLDNYPNRFEAIFIENVINPGLWEFLDRNAYIRDNISYFKRLSSDV